MRVNPGPSISRDWLAEIRNGRAFETGGGQSGVALQFSELQLLNPAGSGVTVTIHRVVGTIGGVSSLFYRTHGTALATLIGNGVNLQIGGAASAAQFRSETVAAIDGTVIRAVDVLANTPVYLAEEWDAVLGPGEGVLVAGATANTRITATFEWVES